MEVFAICSDRRLGRVGLQRREHYAAIAARDRRRADAIDDFAGELGIVGGEDGPFGARRLGGQLRLGGRDEALPRNRADREEPLGRLRGGRHLDGLPATQHFARDLTNNGAQPFERGLAVRVQSHLSGVGRRRGDVSQLSQRLDARREAGELDGEAILDLLGCERDRRGGARRFGAVGLGARQPRLDRPRLRSSPGPAAFLGFAGLPRYLG
mgnify:CR=1 FL=1